MHLLVALAMLVASLALVPAAPAVADPGTLWVNDDDPNGGGYVPSGISCDEPGYNTIQAGINAANPGDTVLVCPGTYPEQLIINKSLTVKSTGGRAVTTVGANLYLVWIVASNVTLEGFTITNPNEMSWADNSAIICTGAGNVSNIKILNNIIEAPASPNRQYADFGTFGINCITGGTLQDVEVAGNIFRNIHAPASDRSGGDAFAMAIFFYSDPISSGINIHDNVIYNVTSAGSPVRARAITISLNVSNSSITCNTIRDNGVGIRLTGSAGSGVAVHYNNIHNNSVYGLWNASPWAVDAENNWWGAANGPSGLGSGSGNPVANTGSGSVDFDPWLTTLQGTPCPPPLDNQGPITANVVASPNPAAFDAAITLTANVDDSTTGGSNIASAEYNIDGGSFSPMSAQDSSFDEVSEDVTASIPAFAAPGLHIICARGTDAAGNVGDATCTILAVYDPSAGFVTGGGAVKSTAGADLTNTEASGPATFGFVSKYLKGKTAPDGNLEFQFKAGDLNFKSTSMEWLVVTGEPRAQFRGEGTINGTTLCKFEADAWDGSYDSGVDAFGLKIFSCASGGDRYTLSATPLSQGSIIIHKK